jgi:hypothetical protein
MRLSRPNSAGTATTGDSSSAGGKHDPMELADRVLVRHRESQVDVLPGLAGNERALRTIVRHHLHDVEGVSSAPS